MLVKLDENLGDRGRQLFVAAGHETATVREQGLAGAADRQIIAACQAEKRCLVTLDLDFSNPFLFPPEELSGIAVIRLPRRASPQDLHGSVELLLQRLCKEPIVGKLWIVERHRIREYTPERESE